MANSKLYVMTESEKEILRAGANDPNLVLGYFLRHKEQEVGFQLDENFTDKGKWQIDMTLASQTFIVAICGIGTGKTLACGLGAVYHAIVTPDFKFLNIARESWQSALMHTYVVEYAKGTLLEKLIVSSPTRPYPKIVIEYILDGEVVHSTLEFMSIGEKEDATNVFSWRGDWINIDEAGRLDDLSGVVANLSTRGTGITPRGRPYVGRLSLTSNPWENPDLWIMFDMAVADPVDSLAINVDTEDNKNVTDKQIKQILKFNNLDGMDKERFLTSKRPEGRGNYFGKDMVDKCASNPLRDMYLDQKKSNPAKVVIQGLKPLGVYRLQVPPRKGRIYFIIGDPGTGAAPARNAPTIMVFDVTDCPRIATLVGFWWGNGGGSITPFVTNLLEWIEYYKPIFAGVDNTGPQKGTAEMINLDHVWEKGLSVAAITGLDFSGGRKYAYLVAARLSLESQMLIWPSFCIGIGSQLKNYDPQVDKSTGSKLAQDNVATLAMAAFAIRAQYGIIESENEDGTDGTSGRDTDPPRYARERDITRTERDIPGRSAL